MQSALAEIKRSPNLEMATRIILSNIDEYDISELILPDGAKEFYSECAHVLSKVPCDIIAKHAVELMSWFQDLNWPGSEQIYATLRSLPIDTLTVAFQKAYDCAVKDADEEWMYNLSERFPDILLDS